MPPSCLISPFSFKAKPFEDLPTLALSISSALVLTASSNQASASPILLIKVIYYLYTAKARDQFPGLALLYFTAASDTGNHFSPKVFFFLSNSTPPHSPGFPVSLEIPHPFCRFPHTTPPLRWGLSSWLSVLYWHLHLRGTHPIPQLSMLSVHWWRKFTQCLQPRLFLQTPDYTLNCWFQSCTWMPNIKHSVAQNRAPHPESLHSPPFLGLLNGTTGLLSLRSQSLLSLSSTSSSLLNYVTSTSKTPLTGQVLCIATAINRI